VSHAIERTTLAQQAYQALRSAILSRRLPAGQKLVVRALAEELGLSPTPVKTALSTLAREGLVVHHPHQGYAVPELSGDDVAEIYALREVVEGLAARLAAQGGSPALTRELARLVARQRRCLSEDVETYGDLDLQFHQRLWEASGNQRLLQVATTFESQVRLLISTSALVPGRLDVSVDEHDEIRAAIEREDADDAEARMRAHVRQAGVSLRRHVAESHTDEERS